MRVIRKTKIVCSMGPATADDEVVKNLILAGMNVARFNFSHGTHDSHRAAMERVRRVSRSLGIPVALLLDTKGPEIRTGAVEGDGTVTIRQGETVLVSTGGERTRAAAPGSPARLSLSWPDIACKAFEGLRILVADGLLELRVLGTDGATVTCRAENTAVIGSRKNVNLIGLHPHLPILSEQDKADLAFGAEMGVDFVAASFLSFPQEVTEIRRYLKSLGSRSRIIAKIESEEGLKNIARITALADAVMVARGDLGVQLPQENIPLAQKDIILACRRAGKPVITATQMLDSMITNPRPTRAELTDVANAIFDGTDAVMLSGETANGAYPVEAVSMMARLALTVENSPEYRRAMRGFVAQEKAGATELGSVMAHAGYETAVAIKARAIVAPTKTGATARLLSAFRPEQPILAVTPEERAVGYMQLLWGVVTARGEAAEDSEGMLRHAAKAALSAGLVDIADKIVLVAGLPLHSPVEVNTVRVQIIGNVLAQSGEGGHADPAITRASGRIIHAASAQDAYTLMRVLGGEILVCPWLTDDYIPILRIVAGVICEGESEISDELLGKINPRLVWLTHVHRASSKFESGLSVTVDGAQQAVYEGIL